MSTTLEYYFEGDLYIKFEKYTIDTLGIITNKRTKEILRSRENEDGYNYVGVYDNGSKRRAIRVARAIASTFIGPPPSNHTVDHINRVRNDDTLDNIRWSDQSEQKNNRNLPETLISAFIIVKDGIEKTAKEWVDYLKYEENHMKRRYTDTMIRTYAQRKHLGFAYKEYVDLPGEVWKDIENSYTWKGKWKISDMNRVKYVTKHAENVIDGDKICMSNGYPKIWVSGKNWPCHILSFKTFFPEKWDNKKTDEIVLHEDDDRLDFRPHKLRLGTQSENITDAHDNGKYDGTLSARKTLRTNNIFLKIK